MGRRRRRGGGGRGKAPVAQGDLKMLMNVVDPGEVRVAIMSDRGLEELYIEKTGGEFTHGNVFKGKVQNVEPSLQAAFVDIGSEKNGFLHVTDVIPPHGGYEGILKKRRRKKPEDMRHMKIEEKLYKGQEVLVQITREQLATKGPSLTTYVSLPGRYLVLMPAIQKRGVSRKITNDKERAELMKALDQLEPPKDLGFIIRTAGMGRGKDELQLDLNYLVRLWEAILERTQKVKPPAPIYRESDLVIRSIRDHFNDEVKELVIDSKEDFDRAKEFLETVMPDFVERASLYDGSEPLFHKHGVEDALEKCFARNVRLPSGGELIIEQTEAMVTIDVNTAKQRGVRDNREAILKTNKEAAAEIARQLRLRDLGGLIMLDFIDMDASEDRKAVEEAFRQALARDRARITTLPISQLGVMEMTRQRVRKSLAGTMYSVCPACNGTGLVKNPEVVATDFVRAVRAALESGHTILTGRLHPEEAVFVANHQRAQLAALESGRGCTVTILPDANLRPGQYNVEPQRGG